MNSMSWNTTVTILYKGTTGKGVILSMKNLLLSLTSGYIGIFKSAFSRSDFNNRL